MIVELFGPPGAGKTTFAHALGARLEACGRAAKLRISSRPGEQNSSIGASADVSWTRRLAAPLSRVARPARELIVAGARATKRGALDASVDGLVAMLPRGNSFLSLRMRQYLFRLSVAWREACASDTIAIFDQGYVQAIAAILQMRRSRLDEDAAAMLRIAPRSDLAVHVQASDADIASRLNRRSHMIGPLGRLFEMSLADSVEQARTADLLFVNLRGAGRPVLAVTSHDQGSLGAEIGRAQAAIETLLAGEGEGRYDAACGVRG